MKEQDYEDVQRPMELIYLDSNGTTPMADEVQVEIINALKDAWGNASSATAYGLKAKSYMDKARQQTADMVNASPSEIIFTSGGTEANHYVLHTFINWKPLSLQCAEGDQSKVVLPHFITSNVEHPAIRKPLEKMVADGIAQVTFVNVDSETCAVDVDQVMSAVQPNTVLITLMMANNETGAVQPIKEIGEAIRAHNAGSTSTQRIYFHTDAAQTIGKMPVDVKDLNVDYLSIVGHKFYAPRIGALYVRELGEVAGCPLKPMFLGGGQESGYRAGTENVAMISGLGKACELVTMNLNLYQRHMQTMRDMLEEKLTEKFGSGVQFNARTEKSKRLPNTCNFSLVGCGFYGRKILDNCRQVIAGVGAACHSSGDVNQGSSVLLASGIPNDVACNAIRLSVGRDTSENDIIQAVEDIYQAFISVSKSNSDQENQ